MTCHYRVNVSEASDGIAGAFKVNAARWCRISMQHAPAFEERLQLCVVFTLRILASFLDLLLDLSELLLGLKWISVKSS